MPCGERCDTASRLINDKFTAFVRQRTARLKQHDVRGVVEPGAQCIGNALGDLGVARHPHDAPISGERSTELRLCRMGNMNERCVTLR